MDALPEQSGRTDHWEDIVVREDPLSTGRTVALEISTEFLAQGGSGGAAPREPVGRS